MLHRLCLCVAIAVLASGSWATPADLVRNAYSAEKNAVYTGTLSNTVYIGGKAERSSVTIYRLRAKSRMEYSSGPMLGSVVIDNGSSVCRLDKSSQTVHVAVPPPSPDNVKLLLSNYNAVSLGTESLAGRKANVIRLEPRTSGNPKAKLWIDTVSGVVLQNERYLHNGKLATRSVFTSIKFTSTLPSSLFSLPKHWKTVRTDTDTSSVTASRLRSEVGFDPLKPSYLPRGYAFDGHFKRYTGSGKPAAVLKYTDGLNSITVFQRLSGIGTGGRGRGLGRRWRSGGPGPTTGRGRCILRSDMQAEIAEIEVRGIMITVTADIDPKQLKQIAESF